MADPVLTVKVTTDAGDATRGLDAAAQAVESVGTSAQQSSSKLDAAADGLDGYARAAKSADKPARAVGESLVTSGERAGDTATAFGLLGPALEALGLGPVAAGLEKATMALDAAEGASVLFRTAMEAETVTKIKNTAMTVKDTASRILHTTATVASTAAQKAAAVATKAWTIAQKLLNAAMRANPIGLAITAVLLLVGAITLAYRRSETFRNIVNGAWAAVKKGIKAVVDWFTAHVPPIWEKVSDAAQTMGGIVEGVWNGIKSAIDAVVDSIDWVMDKIGDLVGKFRGIHLPDLNPFSAGAVPAVTAGAAAPALPGPGRAVPVGSTTAARNATGSQVVVNFNSPIDPEAAARALTRLMNGHTRRVGPTRTVLQPR